MKKQYIYEKFVDLVEAVYLQKFVDLVEAVYLQKFVDLVECNLFRNNNIT